MTTTRTIDTPVSNTWSEVWEIILEEVMLAHWDLDDDLLMWWDNDDDIILASTSNEVTWTIE